MRISLLADFKILILYFAVFSLCLSTQTALSSTGSLPPQASSGKYALLIGIDKYEGAVTPLEGAKNDVKLIREILISRFHMEPQNITMLLDEHAGHDDIKSAFESLARRLNPGDMVYIHYSGHGSYTCDLNGDEEPGWGKDSTWVSYGSRMVSEPSEKTCSEIIDSEKSGGAEPESVSSETLRNYDVLDDEIGIWLQSLQKKTDQVIFVSDSCHSGTVSRGEQVLGTRGAPIDMRPHPLGTMHLKAAPMSGLRVTACRDDEKANEYRAKDAIHGLFTWFWAQSLQNAKPGQTWKNLYQQTCARIGSATTYPQHPQIEGLKDMPVFGGYFQDQPQTIPVTYVSHDGQKAKIAAGSLVRVTEGSVYRLYNSAPGENAPSTLEITRTTPTHSTGKVRGSLHVGDMMVLEHYQHPAEPFKVFIRADLEQDRFLSEKITEMVERLSAYEVTTDEKESKFVIQLLRPKKNKDGQYIYESINHDLPLSFEDQPVECWILNEHEQLYNKKLRIPMKEMESGVELLRKSLTKIAKVKNLTTLFSAPGSGSYFELLVTIWREAPSGQTEGVVEVEGKRWKKEKTITAKAFEEYDLKINSLLSFSVYNKSDRDYYVYLVDITSDADIIPFYPAPYQSQESAKLRAGYKREIEDVTLLVDQPVREYIRLIASLEPINIYVLEQEGFAQRSAQSKLTPLEQLLSTKAGQTRGKRHSGMSSSSWTTIQGTFNVE